MRTPSPRSAAAGRAAGVRVASGGFSFADLVLALAVLSVLLATLLPAIQRGREAARVQETLDAVERVRIAVEAFRDREGVWPPEAPPGIAPGALIPYLEGRSDFQGEGFRIQLRRWRAVETPLPAPEIPDIPGGTPADTLPLPAPTVERLAGLSVQASPPAVLAALLGAHGSARSFVRGSTWTLVFPQRPRL